MIKLGFLVSRSVRNPEPTWELDVFKWEDQIAYSWEELPDWGKKFYDKHTCLVLGAIFQNKYLQDAIAKFRKRFGIPVEGISFIKNRDEILPKPKSKYQYNYNTLVPQYNKAEQYIKRFSRTFIVPNPLKVQLRTLFYSGFVNSVIGNKIEQLDVIIPKLPKRLTNTIYQYRPPIRINLNSSNISKEQMHRLIDKTWPEITKYFQRNPSWHDIGLSEEKLFLIANYNSDKAELEKQMDVLYPMEDRGKSFEKRNPDSLRKEYARSMKVVNQIIRPK